VKIEVAQKFKFDEKENIVEMLQEMDNVRVQNVLIIPNKKERKRQMVEIKTGCFVSWLHKLLWLLATLNQPKLQLLAMW